jgi:uncharacterized protein (DUF1015 family)
LPKLSPFVATHANEGFHHLVAENTHLSLSTEQLTQKLEENPFSYLHIFKPQIHFNSNDKSGMFYSFGKNYYNQLKEQGVLIKDKNTAYYIYKQKFIDGIEFVGIVATAAASDYRNDTIKKHENTLVEKEVLLEKHLDTTGLIGEPVLLTYKQTDSIDSIVHQIMQSSPTFEFEYNDKSIHTFWKVDSTDIIQGITQEFARVQSFYIADGHHRCAAMARKIEHSNLEDCNMLCYLIPDNQLRILPFYRLLNLEFNTEELILSLGEYFEIEKVENPHINLHDNQLLLVLPHAFYLLSLKESFSAGLVSVLDNLNVSILENFIFKTYFKVEDSRLENKIEYFSGKVPLDKIIDLVNRGEFKLAFSLSSLTTQDIVEISEAGLTMPPKSTYVEPKLLSGCLIHEF